MDKSTASLGNLWLPYVVAVAVVAVGIFGGPRSAPIRPGFAEVGIGEPSQDAQSIPARLWQDPLEATEAIRRNLHAGQSTGTTGGNVIPLDQLIYRHTYWDPVFTKNGTIDYLSEPHHVLFQFVSLQSEAYPENGEQRIRARVAVVSALSTAGYRPANASRLGVTLWDPTPEPPMTTQIAYPFEVFELDPVRKLLSEAKQPAVMFDEVIVVYVEDGALQAVDQFEWLKRVSLLLARSSPKQRFTRQNPWVRACWLGPLTSDRLVALLRSVSAEYADGKDLEPSQDDVVPITILSARPTIDPGFLNRIVNPRKPGDHLFPESPWARFVIALTNGSNQIDLAKRCDERGKWTSWISLERLGCNDGLFAKALVHELTLRRPGLFTRTKKGAVVLLSEWDTLYGSALPESFAKEFRKAEGDENDIKRYTYLRGLDGQISGGPEKSAPTDKQKTDLTKPPDSAELFRQLLKSHAPSIAFGRTQVDYIDRLASQMRTFQRADATRRLEAIGILGSDPYDKLLILQGLRKVFPSVQYFTTEMDASLFAPENYDVTRNLIVVSGFDLHLHEKYQQKILPFRDSAQASLYFATLQATEYLTMQRNKEIVGPPFALWQPSVVEIGRNGPCLMKTEPPAGSALPDLASTEAASSTKHSALLAENVTDRETWQRWLVPLVAVAIVAVSTVTHFGRLAVGHAIQASVLACRQFFRFLRHRGKRSILRRLYLRIRSDLAVWLLILATLMFVWVAFCIPRIAQMPDQEPFFVAEGISSWPATWLRALGVFLCGCYFWIIAWQFRHALGNASRELALTAPDCCPTGQRPPRPTPCKAWDHFRRRSRSGRMKLVIILTWMSYVGLAFLLFRHLELPAQVTRGPISIAWEQGVLFCAVFSINLLIIYGVVHNLSCSFFVRKVADWLGNPDAFAESDEPLHTALMRSIGYVAGAMTQMIYYPFTLLFLLMAARHSLFDNFDWPVLLITVFAISSGVLLASTLVLRRSADQARKNAVTWLQNRIASLNWQMTAQTTAAVRRRGQVALQRAEWQLGQVNQVGGAALTEGIFSNPLLRAVLIPIGGTGLLQLMEVAGKAL
ncbi:MAG: hypothetical protein DME97_16595 [Verrucomicrobia bacterium]|nr:MAG: hypothetical protein DME97_16595 [Verrucomicrobiota bacterium]